MSRFWLFLLTTMFTLPIALVLFHDTDGTARVTMTAVLAASVGGIAALILGAAQDEANARTRR